MSKYRDLDLLAALTSSLCRSPVCKPFFEALRATKGPLVAIEEAKRLARKKYDYLFAPGSRKPLGIDYWLSPQKENPLTTHQLPSEQTIAKIYDECTVLDKANASRTDRKFARRASLYVEGFEDGVTWARELLVPQKDWCLGFETVILNGKRRAAAGEPGDGVGLVLDHLIDFDVSAPDYFASREEIDALERTSSWRSLFGRHYLFTLTTPQQRFLLPNGISGRYIQLHNGVEVSVGKDRHVVVPPSPGREVVVPVSRARVLPLPGCLLARLVEVLC